jgi:hypothetical protein
MRRATGPLALVALVVASAAARILLGREIATPFVLVDELIHGELARSVREGFTWHVRGERMTVTFLYPLAIAPAWLADSAATAYGLAKALNAVWMSLAAVPVYLWGRRLVSEGRALVAAALTLAMPSMVFTGTLLAENVFLPAFLLFAWALARALERPTAGRQALVLGAVALCGLARVQGLIALPILVTAAVAFDRRRLRAWWPTGVAIALAAVALVAIPRGLGVYGGVDDPAYSAGALLRWLVYETGALALAVGVVPLVALALVRPRDDAERAFLSVAASATAWLLALATVSSLWNPVGVKERYMLHAMPLLFLALALWVERGLPRPRRTLVVAGAAAAAVAALPLSSLFREPSLLGNAFGLLPYYRLSLETGGVRALVVAVALAAAAAVVLLPRRYAAALPAAVGLYLVAANAPVVNVLRNHSLGVRELARLDPAPAWIDARATSRAAYLNTSNFAPETLRGDLWSQWAPVWLAEYWNRRLDRVISLDYPEPAPLPQVDAKLDWATGRVRGAPPVDWVVATRRFALAGSPRGANGDLLLWNVQAPLRLTSMQEGVYADGRMDTLAAYTSWAPRRPAAVEVLVRGAGATPAAVRVGTLDARSGVGALGSEVPVQRTAVDVFQSFHAAPPPPPYRIEVRVARPGARVEFRVFNG